MASSSKYALKAQVCNSPKLKSPRTKPPDRFDLTGRGSQRDGQRCPAALRNARTARRFRPQFIDEREIQEDGSILLRFGLSKKDQTQYNAIRVELVHEAGSRSIEITDSLRITSSSSYKVGWSHRSILEVDDAEIIEREFRPSIKIDGLPFKTCQRVHDLCGDDPAADIPALEASLAKTKFSKAKQLQIAAAYEAEAEARKSDTPALAHLLKAFMAAGEKRAKARELAADFDPALGPYQFLFCKRQSFIGADQFAKVYDKAKRDADRPMAIIVRQLLGTLDIVNRVDDVLGAAWKDFGQPYPVSEDAIERLKARKIVRETKGALIGLDWLIRAEETIAGFLANNVEYKLSERELRFINYAIDHAAEILRAPGFVLTPEQRAAILNAFKYRISIITGPPGTGKTRALALINFIASSLYSGHEFPVWVVALAGRAASNAREAGTSWTDKGGVVQLHATTIHRALGLQSEGDDGPDAFAAGKKISCGVFVVEEFSMLSSPLFASLLKNVYAKHFLFVGDGDQLPPIGPGKPALDMLAAHVVPTTVLTKNWRTDCQGIRNLCTDMRTCDAAALAKRFSDYEKAGGVAFLSRNWNERTGTAAAGFARLVDGGVAIENIAILSPHKDGDAGCTAVNLAVREALGLDANTIEEGDLLIVSKNNYHAPCSPFAAPQDSMDEELREETIYNGERCIVAKRGSDFLDLEFPQNSEGLTRNVRLLMNDPGGNAEAQLPEDVLFGYAMSTHKAQGSQFDYVIVMAERGYKNYGVVQGTNVYTAVSRARKKVFIVIDIAGVKSNAYSIISIYLPARAARPIAKPPPRQTKPGNRTNMKPSRTWRVKRNGRRIAKHATRYM